VVLYLIKIGFKKNDVIYSRNAENVG